MEILAKEVLFREPDETVHGTETFKHAMKFFGISEVQGKTFEVILNRDASTALMEDILGALIPNQLQFDIGGSTVSVRAKYRPFLEATEGFALEMSIDTWWALMDPPRAFMLPTGEVVFYSSSEIERMKELLKKGLVVYGSPETEQLKAADRETVVQATVSCLIKFMIDFLVDIPGVTDGPNEGASMEEIMEFVESRSTTPTAEE